MKILFLEPAGKGIYYEEFARALKRKAEVLQYGPGLPGYSSSHDIENILNLYRDVKGGGPDLILFGFGWERDTYSEAGYDSNIHGADLNLQSTHIKKAFILNKEYKNLEQKLRFIREKGVDIGFTVHHDYKKYGKETSKEFYQLPFAANPDVFRDYGMEKSIDIGFSGNMFNYGVYKNTGIMGSHFQNIRERVYNELLRSVYRGRSIWWNSDAGRFLYGEGYGKLINSSKVWLNTPSAVQLVGTRFYEIIASKSLLFCRDSEHSYSDLGFIDGETCVTFKDDLSDFETKLTYYLENDRDREKIIESAYELFRERHTWGHRVEFLIEKCS